MSADKKKSNILWVKALLNGILAWVLGFVIYMLPSLIVGFKMGFELGPTAEDPAAVSEQISQTIREMYQNNLLLTVGFIVVTALLIFWRAFIVARGTEGKKTANGLVVAVFPVIFTLLFIFSRGLDVSSLIELLVFIGAGYAGGFFSK